MDKPTGMHDPGSPAESFDSVTELLAGAQAGHSHAWDRVYAVLYDDLHRIAHLQIR